MDYYLCGFFSQTMRVYVITLTPRRKRQSSLLHVFNMRISHKTVLKSQKKLKKKKKITQWLLDFYSEASTSIIFLGFFLGS